LGAYEVTTNHGDVVFLDTPGHEAFSIMRSRGIKVADVAVLMVAADDGVMPQTIEAIKSAKEVGLPLIVAINKVDKATPAQVENVKKGLAQYDLLPEEWGGETVCVPISALKGDGIDDLLEVLSLQAELLELKADTSVAPQGYILESKIEKGLGPVATVICLHGILKLKDHFIAGKTTGKVTSMINSAGKRVSRVLPGIPVQVSGFSELPFTGDAFNVVTKQEARKGVSVVKKQQAPKSLIHKDKDIKTINLVVKSDNVSSSEAIVNAIEKISHKIDSVTFNIVHAGVGDITENDVNLAHDTQALLYGFTVRVEPNALALSKTLRIQLNQFDIIYKLLEDLEAVAEKNKKIKYVSEKIGEASVLKTFDIKNLGVIAGCIVKSGVINKNGLIKVYRGRKYIGEGSIDSLQKERKAVKEVSAGFECGILIKGFNDWNIDDRAECYIDVPEKK
jgi:translation initiation factor IF-2